MTDIKDANNYFINTVLTSVGLPKKGTYNLTEVAKILGVHRHTVRRYCGQGKLIISPAKKVYIDDLIKFFSTNSTV